MFRYNLGNGFKNFRKYLLRSQLILKWLLFYQNCGIVASTTIYSIYQNKVSTVELPCNYMVTETLNYLYFVIREKIPLSFEVKKIQFW